LLKQISRWNRLICRSRSQGALYAQCDPKGNGAFFNGGFRIREGTETKTFCPLTRLKRLSLSEQRGQHFLRRIRAAFGRWTPDLCQAILWGVHGAQKYRSARPGSIFSSIRIRLGKGWLCLARHLGPAIRACANGERHDGHIEHGAPSARSAIRAADGATGFFAASLLARTQVGGQPACIAASIINFGITNCCFFLLTAFIGQFSSTTFSFKQLPPTRRTRSSHLGRWLPCAISLRKKRQQQRVNFKEAASQEMAANLTGWTYKICMHYGELVFFHCCCSPSASPSPLRADGPPRFYRVHWAWASQRKQSPLQSDTIIFEPDASQKNDGPQGTCAPCQAAC